MQEPVLETNAPMTAVETQKGQPLEVCDPQRAKGNQTVANYKHTGRMRVVHIIKHCGYANGSVHVAVDLACVQAAVGHDVTFVSQGGTFEPLLTQYGVRLITLNHDQKKPFSMLRTAWKMTLYARRKKPHVLHAHMMSSVLVGYLVSKFSGVPLVSTVHNSFDRHSFLMRLGKRVVAVSKAEQGNLLRQGYSSRHLDVVLNAPNNSPREAFMKHKDEFNIQAPCITTVCGLHRRKGVFDLIAASAELFTEFPEWTLYIAGEGPDREELEAQAHATGFADRIIFLGFLSCPQVLLEKSDIFVLASYIEPFGLSLAEARAAGCAIVASDVGGISELLDFGDAGRLVPPGNPKRLATELQSLMNDRGELLKMREAALKGSEIFNVNRMVKDYEKVYLVARNGTLVLDS